jgi:hypothetical protein
VLGIDHVDDLAKPSRGFVIAGGLRQADRPAELDCRLRRLRTITATILASAEVE